jgi:hypothetical protein
VHRKLANAYASLISSARIAVTERATLMKAAV